ncbi:MAG TPA: hypothetical protein DCF61_08970 [Alphaproteobacteria bacterium]|nr:hypothetical protein [Alphaproteobacteria bacterium]
MQLDLEFLRRLRAAELAAWQAHFPLDAAGALLEVGAGAGYQAAALADSLARVAAIDLPSSAYASAQIFPVRAYDGQSFPFADGEFDYVYTSHVLEHVTDLDHFLSETGRVLRAGGHAIHVVPTPAWRLWTVLAHYPALPAVIYRRLMDRSDAEMHDAEIGGGRKSLHQLALGALFAPAHGETGNRFTEPFYFRRQYWRKVFAANGWHVTGCHSLGLFYTGYMLCGARLSLSMRAKIAKIAGSASTCFILQRMV